MIFLKTAQASKYFTVHKLIFKINYKIFFIHQFFYKIFYKKQIHENII
jgi:hypothetical protein